MPIYSISAPDGNTYEIEGPDGASQQDVIRAVIAQHPEAGNPPKQDSGFIPAFTTGLQSGASEAAEGVGNLFGLQGLADWGKRHAQTASQGYKPTTDEDVLAAEKQGLGAELGARFRQGREFLGETAGSLLGRYGAPIAAGALGVAAAPEAALGGVGAGAAAFFGTNAAIHSGENVTRQLEQGKDVDRIAAVAAGLGQGVIDQIPLGHLAGKVPMLGGMLGKTVGQQAAELAPKVIAGELTADAATGMLTGTAKNYIRATAENAIAGPLMMTGDEALRRLSAGQDVASPEAIHQYMEGVKGGIAAAPIFGLMGMGGRRAAEGMLRKSEEAFNEKTTKEAQDKQQAFQASDEFKLGKLSDYDKAVAQRDQMVAELNAMPAVDEHDNFMRQQKAKEIGDFVKTNVTPLRDEIAGFRGDIGRLRELTKPKEAPKPVIDESLAKLPAPEQQGLLPAPEKPKVLNEDFMKRGTEAWKDNGTETPQAKQAAQKGSEAPGGTSPVSPISLEEAHKQIDLLGSDANVNRRVIGAFARKLNQSGHIPDNVFKEVARQVRDKDNYSKDDLLNEIKFNLPEYTPPEAVPGVAPPEQAVRFTPEEQAKADKLSQVLSPIMKRFGLGDIKLNFEPTNPKYEAQYHNKVIKMALDIPDGQHVGVLRHESIHALKDLGFFTPEQWKALENRAKSEWIDKYLKSRAVGGEKLQKGQESRYDAYHRETGGNMDSIIEEAIADAFRDHANRKTKGFIGAIIDKIRGFFSALKNNLNGAGFQSAEDIFGQIERGELKRVNTGPEEAPKPSMKNVPEGDIKKAEEYAKENGIMPYLSGEMDSLPTNMEGPKFSFKTVGKKDTEALGLGVPLNANGTVTMYYHTTKDNVVKIANTKKINSDGASRIYFTNESSGAKVFESRGNMDHEIDGSAVLVNIDPRLLQLDMVHPDGRRDFFVAMKEGDYFSRKMTKKIMASSIQHPRDKAITEDGEFSFDKLGERLKAGTDEYRSMTPEQRKKRLAEVRNILKEEHNVGTLLTENGKLEKTRAGEFGVKSEGDSIASMGLGLASAQRISEKTNTCPRRAICEGLCLGDTSGGNKLYGGMPDSDVGGVSKNAFRSGPRMYQYLKTEAMIVHPEEFAFLLQHEIEDLKNWSKKESVYKINKETGKREALSKDIYQPAVRLNVTSDFAPEVFKGIIEGNKDVRFYDYTKLSSEPIADNHHLTYSSTGASQVVNGEVVPNVESNWRTMRKRLDNGQNVAMAFTSRDHMPKYLIDEETGQKYQVWDGDNYDARFADPKPNEAGNEFGKGMIIGLTNKDATTNRSKDMEATAAKKYNGFFIDYNKDRDGDTVTIQNQSKFADAVKAKREESRQAKAAEPKPVQIVKQPKASLRTDTGSENFKKWFRESKILDSEGKPLVLYHGGNHDFLGMKSGKAVFTYGKAKGHGRGAPPDTDMGFFFTPSEQTAKFYSQFANYHHTRSEPLPPVEVYLSIQNPYRATLQEWSEIKNWGSMDNQKYKTPAAARGAFKALKAKLVAEGYDGVIVGKEGTAMSEYIAFHPEQIKSATHNTGEFNPENKDIRKSLRSQDPFYSALRRGVDNITDKPLPAEGWKGFIKSMVNKGEVKAAEVEWSGVNDWLDMQKGKVTKQQMQEFLDNNGVKVEEVQLGGPPKELEMTPRRLLAKQYDEALENSEKAGGALNPEYIRSQIPKDERIPQEQALLDAWDRVNEHPEEDSSQLEFGEPTLYDQHTLPGGKNYREILLTTPQKNLTRAQEDRLSELIFKKRRTEEETEEMNRLNSIAQASPYKSSHWPDHRNVIAHIRLIDRVDANGKKVLFVEEIQSDWGQEGREHGFGPKDAMKYKIEEQPYDFEHYYALQGADKKFYVMASAPGEYPWSALDKGFETKDAADRQVEKLKAKAEKEAKGKKQYVIKWEDGTTTQEFYDKRQAIKYAEGSKLSQSKKVPKAPFVTNTEGWLNIALKRIMKMSADEGYDKVAFINGKQTHDRFPEKHSGESSLAGFQSFYDSIVPKATSKLVEKLGGAKVEPVEMDVGTQLGFPITDKMRESTAGGLPMFSLRSSGWNDKRLKRLKREYEDADEGTTYGFVARVNPIDFVRATVGDEYNLKRIQKEAGKFDQPLAEGDVSSPFIQWNQETNSIVGHEGRHRMAALAQEGVRSTPVVIQVTNKNGRATYGEFEPQNFAQIKPQFIKSMSSAGDFGKYLTLKDLTPIASKYDDLLMQRFGGDADIKYSLRTAKGVGYHAGDLGYGTDTALGRMTGGRDTGHFGTGVYYYGKEEDAKMHGSSTGQQRPVHEINLEGYKLARPRDEQDADDLFKALRGVNRLHNFDDKLNLLNRDRKNTKDKEDIKYIDDDIKKLRQDFGREFDSIVWKLKSSLGRWGDDVQIKQAIIHAVKSAKDEYKDVYTESTYVDSASTRLMKELGYEGVDVRHIPKYDTGEHGSVVYTKQFEPKAQTDNQPKASIRSRVTTLPNGAAIMQAIDRTTYARPDKTFIDRMFEAISPHKVAAAYRAEGMSGALEQIRQSGVHSLQRIGTNAKRVADIKGRQTLLADYSAEAAALHSEYASGVAASALGAGDRMGGIPVYRNGFTKVSNENGTVKGAVAIFAPLAKYNDPKAYQAYQFWAATKRGSRLMADGREHMFTPQEIAYGRQIEQQFPEFKNIQKEWIKYNDGLVKYMVDTGVLSKEAGAEFSKHSDYIPFYRQLDGEETLGPKVFQSMISVKAPEKLKGGKDPLGDFMETIVRNTHAAVTAGMKNVAAQRAVRDAVDLGTARKLNASPQRGQDVVKVLENGKLEHYEVADPILVDAMTSLNMPEIPFMSILAGPANLLRTVVTKMPDFMLANMMRDSLSAYTLSGAKITPVVSTINQFGRNLVGRTKEVEALYNAGILGNHEFSGGVEKSAEAIKKQMRQEAGHTTTGEYALKPVTSLWHALERGSEASESATRAAVYKSVLAKTGNEAEAMFQALELMNFKRKGNSPLIRVLAAAVPFLNARMQGLDLMYRVGFGKMATQDPQMLRRAMLVRAATITGLTAMYYSMIHDDPVYKNQEQETKDNYWIIPSLGVKIPIPFEIGTIFKTIPERLMALSFGGDTGKDFLHSMGRAVTSTLAFNPMPQVGKPIYEGMANYDFFTGRSIVPSNMENLDPKMQKGPNTTKVAQALGEQLGVSPMKIDHMISGYTGSMGLYLTSLVGAMFDMNDPVESPSKRIYEMPVLKRFLVNPDARGTVTGFYEMKKAVDEVVRTSNYLEREGDMSKYADYMKSNMDVYAMRSYIQTLDKNMQEMNRLTTMIRSNPSMSGDRKRELLGTIQQHQNALTANIQTIKGLMKQ